MTHCPGCGAKIGTPPQGLHVLGCGFEGDHANGDQNQNRGDLIPWERNKQISKLKTALENVGLDGNKAGELLDELKG
jgi:hypothetical protein